ncbi:YadA-like family protein [Veillonella montpellierensis]|uniref:YadA-like family protein n=1 Tax=Veillonella montpellierensis TaxID=187328 RepID=UPI0031401336
MSSTALGEEAIAEALCSTAVGKGAHANGESSTAVGYEAKALVDGGVALGSGSIASINKGIVGYDPSTGEASTETSAIWKATQAAFSVGSAKDKNNLITRQITNVAAGSKDTDAVNVAQLKALATAPMKFYFGGTKDKGTNVYTPGTTNWSMSLNEFRMDFGDGLKAEQVTDKDNKKYTRVTLDVEKVENIAKGKTTELKNEITKEMHEFKTESVRGDALGAALSALKPLDYDPYNRSQIMAGVSTYKGQEAVALGLAHYSNENTLVHAGLSYAGSSELMANVGVSYRFGNGEDKEAQKARNLRMPQYDKGPISSVYMLQDEVQSLKRENDAIRKENKEAKDRIAVLEAKLEKVLEKVK